MKKYAIALYDNEAESEDELDFKKNDLFQVLQIDYEGMEGWWLCKSLKTNLVGLAAGNRLKLVTDEKILNKLVLNTNDKLSASSSSSSILSSNSSANSVKSLENDLHQLNLNTNNNNNKTPKKLILPPKNEKKASVNPSLLSNDDDDYDYDVPENNQPTNQLIKQKSSSNDSDKEETRKSTSPTIDSGISTCSLVSCNSDISIKSSKHLSSDEEITSLKSKFNESTSRLQITCRQINLNLNINSLKQIMSDLRQHLYEFISDIMKRCKQEHACFHHDLNVFNKFKAVYRQLKEFYLYYESTLQKLTNIYQWNNEILLKEPTDLNELITKLTYLNELIDSLKQLVETNNLFDYHSQTTSDFNKKIQTVADENSYEYEYDNNPCPLIRESSESNDYDDVYENIYDDSNYCLINDDTTTGNANKPTKTTPNLTNCLTLKKNEEIIKREIRIATTNSSNETTRINMVDQMLLKFYLKHIEDNLNELKSTYDVLLDEFKNVYYVPTISSHELEHKLAIYGHKLVFICDTLERNLNNIHLKSSLNDSSNCLSDALKVYMIRIKSRQQLLESNSSSSYKINKQSDQFVESLNNVFNASNQFKQLIIKYYVKSY